MASIDLEERARVVPIWIRGAARPFDDSRIFAVRSSAQNGRVIHFAQGASVADAVAAAQASQDAFMEWRNSSHVSRRELLLHVATIYETRAEELVGYQVAETSCTEQYARFNILLACRLLREFAGQMTTALTGEVPPVATKGFGVVFKEPVGVALIIPPWNSSIILSTRGVAAALAAGCTVVMKSSELCPRTHHFVVQAFEEAGLPKGCLNTVQADRANAALVTEALISHSAIKKIEFVGSASVGRIIGQYAAKHLKPVLMELGGKGPAIVLADANLDNAARLCALGAFLHHGQICFSTERIIVVKAVAPDFVRLLQAEVESRYSGPVGHAVTTSGASRAKKMLDDAASSGAKLIAGTNSFTDASQTSLLPTIIADVKPTDEMYDQETFGPSAALYVVEDESEAIALANASAYGLNASIHTRDVFKALALSRRLEYGQVHINSTTTYDEETMPITGFKQSGWGSNNGRYGISEFLVNKSVTLHDPDEAEVSFGVA